MNPGRQRANAVGKCPATTTTCSWQSPRILVVDIHPPQWDHTCHKLCEALENVFCLACSLTGPPRIPSFSLYVVQNQQECLLPFVAVKGGFARLQSCLAELCALPREGAFQPRGDAVVRAVLDGLQQFEQRTGQGTAGASLSSSSVEITVLTSQPSRQVANRLDAGLQGIDLFSLHQLQVVEVSQRGVQELSGAEWGGGGPSSSGGSSRERERTPRLHAAPEGKRSPIQGGTAPDAHVPVGRPRLSPRLPSPSGPSSLQALEQDGGAARSAQGRESTTILNTEISLHTVENDLVALEDFFKAWLHGHSPDQEHLHLLLPAGTVSSSAAPSTGAAQVKCDVQERFLSPAQLPAACDGGTARVDEAIGPSWMASGPAPRKLRVLRALKADGVCASVLSGLPLVIRPTSCWQLSWEELEANQQRFQALCHCLRKRGWLLLARYESQGRADLSGDLPVGAFQVLLPSDSSTLLLRPVVARELLLPCGFPLLPADPPGAVLAKMEVILDSLELEASYDPLRVTSHLYQALKKRLGRLPASRAQRQAPRQWPRQHGGRAPPSKTRATVAPRRGPPLTAGSGTLPLCPSKGKETPGRCSGLHPPVSAAVAEQESCLVQSHGEVRLTAERASIQWLGPSFLESSPRLPTFPRGQRGSPRGRL